MTAADGAAPKTPPVRLWADSVIEQYRTAMSIGCKYRSPPPRCGEGAKSAPQIP